MVTLIGGLARVTGCSEEQIAAAERYRRLWDRAQGRVRTSDYGQLRVDGNRPSDAAVLGADARREYAAIVQRLGLVASSSLERVIVHDMSLRKLAASLGIKRSGNGSKKVREQLFAALDRLVDHFGVVPGTGATSSAITVHRDAPPNTFVGEIATRRQPLKQHAPDDAVHADDGLQTNAGSGIDEAS
ncbi:MAG: hypothetical protein ABIQ30_00205 [Devosia sp.]